MIEHQTQHPDFPNRGYLFMLLADRQATDTDTVAPDLRKTLDVIQPDLQTYLDRAVDLPLTTHRWDHVLKVEYLCNKLALSSLLADLKSTELFVLILSIWLHDAGMVPENDSETEKEIRRRHPTRIANRIRNDELSFLKIPDPTIRRYVAQVCRNHCEPSPTSLKASALYLGGTIRLQLISALLRLSDICEAAYDRVPVDVLAQYVLPKDSEPYWRTHKLIDGIDVERSGEGDLDQLRFQAGFGCETDRELLQKAIAYIEDELRILKPVFSDYGWELSAELKREIEEVEHGGNTRLKVDPDGVYALIREHIYGSPDVYIRELVQNAIDSCTRKRFQEGSDAYSPQIAVTEFVSKVDDVETSVAVKVKDNGTGMHGRDIDEFLLTVGSPGEKDLPARAPDTDLISEFGVGFVSCFPVAESILVATKKDGFRGLLVTCPDLDSGGNVRTLTIEVAEWHNSAPRASGSSFIVVLNKRGGEIGPRKALEKWYRHPKYDSFYDRITLDQTAPIDKQLKDYLVSEDQHSDSGQRLHIVQESLGAEDDSFVFVSSEGPIRFGGYLGCSRNGKGRISLCQQGLFVESVHDLVQGDVPFITGEINLEEKFLSMPASRSQVVRDERFFELQRSLEEQVVMVLGHYLRSNPLSSAARWDPDFRKSIRSFLNR